MRSQVFFYQEGEAMKSRWLRGLVLGVSMAGLLNGLVAVA